MEVFLIVVRFRKMEQHAHWLHNAVGAEMQEGNPNLGKEKRFKDRRDRQAR